MDEFLPEIIVNEFTDEAAIEFRQTVVEASKNDPRIPLYIYIQSSGGEVEALAAMIETLQNVPNPFHTICLGKAYSAGAILLSFGQERWCASSGVVMLHEISSAAMGTASDIQIDAAEIKRVNEFWMRKVAKNCDETAKDILRKVKEGDIYLSARKAKAFGIIDHIGLPKIQFRRKHASTLVGRPNTGNGRLSTDTQEEGDDSGDIGNRKTWGGSE